MAEQKWRGVAEEAASAWQQIENGPEGTADYDMEAYDKQVLSTFLRRAYAAGVRGVKRRDYRGDRSLELLARRIEAGDVEV
jgi:hypothetical protein